MQSCTLRLSGNFSYQEKHKSKLRTARFPYVDNSVFLKLFGDWFGDLKIPEVTALSEANERRAR